MTVEVGIPTLVGIATAAHFETTKVGVGIVSNLLEFVFLFEEDAAIDGDLSHPGEGSHSRFVIVSDRYSAVARVIDRSVVAAEVPEAVAHVGTDRTSASPAIG